LIAYNQAEALRQSIAALEASEERERLEILVVDCGSGDDSPRVDTQFPAVQILRLPHHLGSARAMNIALRTAKADLVFFVAPGVVVEPGTVRQLAEVLEPESEMVAVAPVLADPQGAALPQVRPFPSKAQITAACSGAELPAAVPEAGKQMVDVAYPALDALMARKAFLRGMNFFDERYGHAWTDLELAMQIRGASKKARILTSAHAVRHAVRDPLAGEGLADTDRYAGAAAFLSKYSGAMAGIGFRLSSGLGALARFRFGQAFGILGGSKLDGSQAG
jgi:GT2 family glycosyltransferase